MRNKGLIAAALSAALTGCGFVHVVSFEASTEEPATGPTSTKTYDLAQFSKIRAGSIFEIEYSVGQKTHVEIEAQQSVFDHIQVTSEQGELRLKLNGNLRMSGPIKVRLTSPSLDAIDLSGASKGRFEGIDSRKFEADLSGAANAKVSGSAGEMRVDVSGSAELETATHGHFTLRGTLSGSGNLKAGGEVSRLDIQASGSSHVDLARVVAKEGVVQLDGASWLTTKGSVDALSVATSGASHADLGGVKVGMAKVTADGGSHVSMGETRTLTADASGASSVHYKGNPQVTRVVSGVASVGPG